MCPYGGKRSCINRVVCAGVLILIDIILNFSVGVVVQHNLRALYGMQGFDAPDKMTYQHLPAESALTRLLLRAVLHGGVIARMYVRHGSFWIDLLSLLPIVPEVCGCLAASTNHYAPALHTAQQLFPG